MPKFVQYLSKTCMSIRVFHKRTELAILTLLPTLYSQIYLQFPYLSVTYDASKYENEISVDVIALHFKVVGFIGPVPFLMAQLKRSWQYWHSCIVESLSEKIPYLSDLNPSLSYHLSFAILPNWQPQKVGHWYIFNKFWISWNVQHTQKHNRNMLHLLQYFNPYVDASWENEDVPFALTSQQMTSHLVYCYLTSYLTVVQFPWISHEQSPYCAVQTP